MDELTEIELIEDERQRDLANEQLQQGWPHLAAARTADLLDQAGSDLLEIANVYIAGEYTEASAPHYLTLVNHVLGVRDILDQIAARDPAVILDKRTVTIEDVEKLHDELASHHPRHPDPDCSVCRTRFDEDDFDQSSDDRLHDDEAPF